MQNCKSHKEIYKLYTEANQSAQMQPALSPRQPPEATPPSASYDWRTIEDPIKEQFIDSLLADMKAYISFKEHGVEDSPWSKFSTPGDAYKDFIQYVASNAKDDEEQF